MEAKTSAATSAMLDLQGAYFGSADGVLSEKVIEKDHFWMFFQREDIIIPHESSLRKSAYAISRHTDHGRCVADLRDEPERLEAYLEALSGFFERDAAEPERIG